MPQDRNDTRSTAAVAVTEAILAGALLAAASYQRGKTGVQLELILLGVIVLPLHVRRLLAWRGKLAPAPRWGAALEVAALMGVGGTRVAGWALAAAVAACLPLFAHAPTGEDEPASTPALAVASLASLAVLLGAAAVLAAPVPAPLSWLLLAGVALVVAEAFDPRRARDGLSLLRRVAAAGALAATAWVRGGPWLLVLATSAAAVVAPLLCLPLRRAPVEERPRRRRRYVLRMLVPTALLALLWVAGEVAFRLGPGRAVRAAPVLRSEGALHQPGATFTFRYAERVNAVRWNRHGWHDVDHEVEKPAGTVRVLVLGDSYVEGVQVEREQLYHRVLERRLAEATARPVEAIAYGWSGWGQRDQLRALVEGSPARPAYPPGLALKPDLVISEFLALNDVRDNSPALVRLADAELQETAFARRPVRDAQDAGLPFTAFLFEKLHLFARRLRGRRDPVDIGVLQPEPARHAELWAAAWAETRALLERMRDALAREQVPFVVVIFSSSTDEIAARGDPAGGTPPLDWNLPGERVRAWCAELGIACLDLPARFASLSAEERAALHIPGEGHWSAAGHRRGAEETARFLLSSKLWERALAR